MPDDLTCEGRILPLNRLLPTNKIKTVNVHNTINLCREWFHRYQNTSSYLLFFMYFGRPVTWDNPVPAELALKLLGVEIPDTVLSLSSP